MKSFLAVYFLILWTETLELLRPEPGPEYADVVFLVDSSDDLDTKSFPFVRTFLHRIISSLPIEVNKYRVALAQYSDTLHNEFQLSTFKGKNPMLNHIKKNFRFLGGSLQIGNALHEAHRTYFSGHINGRDKKQFPPILVVLASGESEDDVEVAAQALKKDGVRIIAVGIQKASEENLRAMATGPFHFKLRMVRDLSTFSKNMTQIIREATKYKEAVAETDEIVPVTMPVPVPVPVPVPLPLPLACQRDSLADIVFLVDSSVGSLRNLRHLQNFLRTIATSMDVRKNCVQLGLMSYTNRAEILFFLKSSTSRSEFLQQTQKLSVQSGRSNTRLAIEKLERDAFSVSSGSRIAQGVPQMAVLITQRPSDENVREVAMDLRLMGVSVFALSIEGANNTQLEDIASYPPEETVTKLNSYADLESYSETFLKKIRNKIWSQIFVRAEHKDLEKIGCMDTQEADIYFLIDGSSSIQPKQFEQIKKFMLDIIKMFTIVPDKVRFGVVQYSHKIEEEFDVGDYSNEVDLQKAVSNIKQLQGDTTTGKALDFILLKIKNGRTRRSIQAPHYLIVLTDGKSMDSVLEPAEKLRAKKVTIYAIGIGSANKTQLGQIAGTEERVIFGQSFDSLQHIKDKVVHGICSHKACENMKIDLMFLMDSSGSIGEENFSKMKIFMKNLINRIEIGPDKTQIGVVQFSDDSKEEFQLGTYLTRQEIDDAIDRIDAIGRGTNTGHALTSLLPYFTPARGARVGVRQFLIVITDGEAQDSVVEPAQVLRDSGVIIFSVGVYGANRTQLEEISGNSSQVFQVENFDLLKNIEEQLIFQVCALHDCKGIEKLDVVFVLDQSSSIQPQDQESMINLAIHLVKEANVGRDRVQFGALKYSDYPEVLFHLNTYSHKSAIIEHLKQYKSSGGNTYTARALNYTNKMFTEEYGSRLMQNVAQILIIITDGESHDKMELNNTALALRNRGINIYAVGVGEAKPDELEGMAGDKAKAIHVSDFKELEKMYQFFQEEMCQSSSEDCRSTDVIFLCDSSKEVSTKDFSTMKVLLSDLYDMIGIQPQKARVGVALFGKLYQEKINLDASLTKTEWKAEIQALPHLGKNFTILTPLLKVIFMFSKENGGRREAGIPQNLVVITSQPPDGDVSKAVEKLKEQNIRILVISIGIHSKDQFLPLTGNPDYIISLKNFQQLNSALNKKRIVREICQQDQPSNCTVNVVVGFDISTHVMGQRLFDGHSQLESVLPGILEEISSISGVSCGGGSWTQVSMAFKVNSDQLSPTKFFIYKKDLFKKLLLTATVNGPSHLNGQFLQTLWDTFEDASPSQGQVLLIFSDGLGDESAIMLEEQSDRLRAAGLDALLVVSLNTASHEDFSYFEFGKGFDYRTHLTIGMKDVGTMLARYLGNIAERTCCCQFCKCVGPRGERGIPGKQLEKGQPGIKGSRGHWGEDGEPGKRGDMGPTGEKGIAGCSGERGQKGVRGVSGYKGDVGEHGIDGIDGEEGFHGLPGVKGEKGEPGSQGSPGYRGSPGEYGEKGFPGDPGQSGRDSRIKGQKGSKGEEGGQGRTGQKGAKGSPSSRGIRGREGRRGNPGTPGISGNPGLKGELGPEGLQGRQGSRGPAGRKGEKGNLGLKGPQGAAGPGGPKGNMGSPGLSGIKGEAGVLGGPGPFGQMGHRGKQGDDGIPGYGQKGRKGIKGPRGFTGEMGQKGDVGDPGTPGVPGPKGFKGLAYMTGSKGEGGPRGNPGPPGRRGPKGMPGLPSYPLCDLILFLRNKSSCWKDRCPVYPTELVFALDQSFDIGESRFNEMRDHIISIVEDLDTRTNNCPVGARVVVVSYDFTINYLIRQFDYHNKKQLIQLLSQISYQPPTGAQDIGSAMRFVARNVFKHTSAGTNVRRVAVFFSNAQTINMASVITATMEFSGLDISLAVMAANERIFLDAFEFDNTGMFQAIRSPPGLAYIPDNLWRCTLCYDKCFPNNCAREIILPEGSFIDVAFLIDNSRSITSDEFKALKTLVRSMLGDFKISSNPSAARLVGDRIALLSYAPLDSSRRVINIEFDFTTFNNQDQMENYIQTSFHQLNGEENIGYALRWIIENLFPRTPNLRQHRVIIVVSAGENKERKDFLKRMALKAKCQGYVLFVISLGSTHGDYMEELASYPPDHHLIQLGKIHKPDLDYIVRFLKPFVYSVRRKFNRYPPDILEDDCRHYSDRGDNYDQFTPEPPEISSGESSFLVQELSAEREMSFVLEENGSNHLVYLPNHVIMPQEVLIKYEKDENSEEMASLHSGKEMKSFDGKF